MNSFRLFQWLGVAPWCFAATYIPVSEFMWNGDETLLGAIGCLLLILAGCYSAVIGGVWLDEGGWSQIEAWYAKEREKHCGPK